MFLFQLRAALIRRYDTALTEIVLRSFVVLERRGEYEARRLREEDRVLRRMLTVARATYELMCAGGVCGGVMICVFSFLLLLSFWHYSAFVLFLRQLGCLCVLVCRVHVAHARARACLYWCARASMCACTCAQHRRLFGLHLDEESGGRVTLKRLERSSQPFLRCRRATIENARKDFFSKPGARYKGV